MEKIRHNCGVCVAHDLHDTYSFLDSLQHRGREAAGIAAIGYNRIDVVKWIGNVGMLSRDSISRIFGRNTYHTFMGHVRYATKGDKDYQNILNDAHPHTIGGDEIKEENHRVINDCDAAIVHNGHIHESFFKNNTENLSTGCDSEMLLHYFVENGEKRTLIDIPLAYVAAFATKKHKEVVVLRDRTGIRPAMLGIKDNKHCMVSEDVALNKNGGKPLEDLNPGAAYYFDSEGNVRKEIIIKEQRKHCMFGPQYLQSDYSTVDGINVRMHKTELGKVIAREIDKSKFDFVTYLPESPEIAAISCANHTGIEFIPVFYKLRGERSFQGSTSKERKNSIETNLYLSPHAKEEIRDKSILLIDDSMVRGNNVKRARDLLYKGAKVREATYFLYTPPIGILKENGAVSCCKYGVDMPENDNFIARDRSLEEICKEIKMPVQYISKEGFLEVFKKEGFPEEELCFSCIGGPDPLNAFDNTVN